MKKTMAVTAALLVAFTSCSLIKTKVKIDDVVAEKVKMDGTTNPAKSYLILGELKKKSVVLDDVVVKKVTASTNIDYDFCIIADVKVGDKKVECYIYTKNVYKVSNLVEGVTRINVVGDFKRFFTTLDEYYTKVEIVQAKVTPYDPEKAKKEAEKKAQKDKAQKDKAEQDKKKSESSEQGGSKP